MPSSAAPGGPVAATASITFVAGPLVLDEASRRVKVLGAWVTLTALEFALLACLVRHPHQAFSREELLGRVWGYTFGDGSTVTVHVRRLREKIEADPLARCSSPPSGVWATASTPRRP